MKYIRYENDIYEVIEEEENCVVCAGRLYPTHKDDIEKQADSIEKICDEFVAVRKNDNTKHLGKIDCIWFVEQTGWVGKLEDYKSIYGAIWIEGKDGEPILKPVAKLNDEEELELL